MNRLQACNGLGARLAPSSTHLIIFLGIALGLSAGVAWACRSYNIWIDGKQCLCTECGGTTSCIC